MVPGSPAEQAGGPSSVYLVGEPTARKALVDELADVQDRAEPVSLDRPADLDPPALGVVCLPPADPDRSVSDLVARTPAGFDCPVVAVGPEVDAPAAYESGTTEVIPLSPTERTDLVTERVAAAVDRVDPSSGRAADSDNTELVEALSTAFPDYAFVYDEEGRYLDVMTGRRTDEQLYDEAELLGRTVHDFFDAETADRVVETIGEALATGDVQTVEYDLDRPDGASRYRARIAPLAEPYEGHRAAVLVARDVTERRERQRALERAERRFEAVFNAPSALVTLLDTGGHVEEISDAALALVEESRDEIRRHPLWEGPWFEGDPDLQDRLREAVNSALDGESARIEASVPAVDRELVVDAMFEPIVDDAGELRGVLGVARDVTERHRDQRLRRQMLSTTREMMGAESREQLAGMISRAASSVLCHDINVVYLAGEEADSDSVDPVGWSDRVEDLFGGPPTPTGAGPVSETYRTGEPAIYDTLQGETERPVGEYDPVTSLLALPLGEHGVLAVGATDPVAFAETDIDRYRLLTVSAATAFDHLERTLDLQRYETLFETVQDKVYVLDEDGYIELVSDPLAETVGYDREELVGEHVSTVVTDGTAREVEHLILDLLVTPEEVSSVCEGTLVARDDTETPIEIELSVLPHEGNFRGTAGVVRDISERRQREEELRVFQQAITEAGIGLAMYGADGRFEYLNGHYADLLGQSRETLGGSPVWETFESLTADTFESHWQSLGPDETEKREREHVRRDGSTVPVETVATAVEIDGVRHHILTVQDITDRRERRQQTQALHRIFRHNLRNDLTVLYAHANILADELPSEFASNAGTVVRKTNNLIELTETANEARTVLEHDTSRKPVDAVELVAERVADLRLTFDATVETDLPDERYVWADPMLGVAVRHLLTNAIEHNESHSPRVWVRIEQASDREDWVAIEVADDGPGLPDIERETLAAGREGQITHSVGLGLWIVRWIVSRYGGDFSFRDRDPCGTCVRIALPAADEQAAQSRPAEDRA
jgi:PAS domain S-box-containing protein